MGSALVGRPPRALDGPLRRLRTVAFAPVPNRYARLALAGLLVANVGAAVGALVHLEAGSPSVGRTAPGPPAPPAPVNQAAVSWVLTQLPHDAVVVADARTGGWLAGTFPRLRTVPAADLSGAQYVVTTDAVRAAARTSSPLARLLAAGVPVAVFGSGPTAVVVAGIAAAPVQRVRAARARDAASRRRAEPELLANKNVRTSTAARAVLRHGGLDLRAATVLAVLAGKGRVSLLAVRPVAAETAAGLPARTIDVRVRATRLRSVLAAVAASYRPATEQPLAGGTVRLTWPVSLTGIGG